MGGGIVLSEYLVEMGYQRTLICFSLNHRSEAFNSIGILLRYHHQLIGSPQSQSPCLCTSLPFGVL